MNILIIEPLGDGGIAHYTFNLAEAFHKINGGVHLFTNRTYELSSKDIDFTVHPRMFRLSGMLIRTIPALNRETLLPSIIRRTIKLVEYPFNVFESLWVIFQNQIQVVHIQSVNLVEFLMVLAFKMIGKPVVFTIHNVNPRHGRLRFHNRVLYRWMYSLCNQIIIHTESGRQEAMKLFLIKPDKISVIPHGDYKFFTKNDGESKTKSKELLGLNASSRTVLFFGAIRPNKGLDLLIRSLALIKKRHPGVKLLIVGELCEDFGKYRSIIQSLHVSENILEKLEYVSNEDVHLYFEAADVVALPYQEITQSGVLQVAYAFAKPVVATALEGFKESIENGRNGFLIESDDVPEMANRISQLLDDEQLMNSMGARSLHLADTKTSWSDISRLTCDVYRKTIDQPTACSNES